LEVIVFACPNETLQEFSQLSEDVLKTLFPEDSTIDVRILRSMAFELYAGTEEAAPGSTATAATEGGEDGGAEDSAEAQPDASPPPRSAKAEWLAERLLSLASSLESQFGAPRQEPGVEVTYEGCEHSAQDILAWLADAGLRPSGSLVTQDARSSMT